MFYIFAQAVGDTITEAAVEALDEMKGAAVAGALGLVLIGLAALMILVSIVLRMAKGGR